MAPSANLFKLLQNSIKSLDCSLPLCQSLLDFIPQLSVAHMIPPFSGCPLLTPRQEVLKVPLAILDLATDLEKSYGSFLSQTIEGDSVFESQNHSCLSLCKSFLHFFLLSKSIS